MRVRAAAIGAYAGEIVVTPRGVGIAVVGEGVGKSEAALIFFAGDMVACRTYVIELVVILDGEILRTAENRRSVRS